MKNSIYFIVFIFALALASLANIEEFCLTNQGTYESVS